MFEIAKLIVSAVLVSHVSLHLQLPGCEFNFLDLLLEADRQR